MQKELGNIDEGYYLINKTKRLLYWDGSKWMKPIKDSSGRHGTWLSKMERQPKVLSAEWIDQNKL